VESTIEPEKKKRALIIAVAARTATTIAWGTTLKSLITWVISEEIVLSDSGATIRTPLIKVILKRLMQSIVICPYLWH